ncbi:helix-turn-helix domain-containing protein [Massilia niastensis]|uniref:helix-turn-helix domain-containing protein n=1 Tax=Massilia niastensis TaxID=544911 RepID=UPI0003A4BFCE|nr:AraC family transcriptional regulator [Massilia niastensis]
MHEFYKRTLLGFLCLLSLSVVVGYACFKRSHVEVALLPAAQSAIPWNLRAASDLPQGGRSTVQIHDDRQRLRVDFHILKSVDYPFAAAELFFEDGKGKPVHADLSHYTSVSFLVKCSPLNTLTFSISTFDPRVSRRGELLSYRTPAAFFSCSGKPSRVELDLTRLEIPQWWFDMFKQDLSQQAYRLDQVPKITFGSTFQSPKNTDSSVDIGELVLNGRDYRYLVLLGVFLLVCWGGFAIWFFRQHTRALIADVKEKLRKDMPLVAYQQLSMEPHRDREKSAILEFIAVHYADAELDLERVVVQTGVNRNKVNEILKSELGFTFSSYLNKLRLTEAARLLAEKDKAAVAEIAYSVGYSNVSYFNKLFKEEYGCTPKAFRSVCDGQGAG